MKILLLKSTFLEKHATKVISLNPLIARKGPGYVWYSTAVHLSQCCISAAGSSCFVPVLLNCRTLCFIILFSITALQSQVFTALSNSHRATSWRTVDEPSTIGDKRREDYSCESTMEPCVVLKNSKINKLHSWKRVSEVVWSNWKEIHCKRWNNPGSKQCKIDA